MAVKDDGYAIALINEVAVSAHRQMFWYTPYRTGALARGASSVVAIGGGAGFSLLTQHTQYGAILNEAAVINYRITNQKTGRVYTGQYNNKHYGWVNRAAEGIAAAIPFSFPNIRRIV